jgi:hypothetical protein
MNMRTDGPGSATRSDERTTDGRRGFVAGMTEARPGFMTTEFWLSLIAAVTIVIAGYVSDTFDNDLAWALGAGLIAAYALSRGLAKSGSREGPFAIDLRRDNDDR